MVHYNMISHFIESKLRNAAYKLLLDGTYFGEIKGVHGVWANASTLEECRTQLQEVLEDWLVVKIKSGDRVPGLHFDFDQRRTLAYA